MTTTNVETPTLPQLRVHSLPAPVQQQSSSSPEHDDDVVIR